MSALETAPLLLLHGFPMDSRMWRHVTAHFGPDRTIVAPNAAELVADGPAMASMAERAVAELEAAAPGEQAVVVGLSMGGYIAEEIARTQPDRLAALVLCDTRATADTAEGRAGRDAMIEATRKYGVVHATAPMVPRLLHDPGRAALGELEAVIGEQDPEVIIACIEAMRDRPDQSETLRKLTVPLLVVVGEHDALSPPEIGASIAAMAPNGRFALIPRAGHVPPLENPAAFNDVLEHFLCGAA